MIWEVFYSPHTDDETIGMAGAIVRARDAGHSVLVCLVTDNLPSSRGWRLFPRNDLAQYRRAEWRKAMEILDVTELQEWDLPEDDMPHRMLPIRAQISERIREIHQSRLVVHHHTTWGLWDENQGVRCLAHDLCANALLGFHREAPETRVSLYSIYEYAKPHAERSPTTIQHLSYREITKKQEALRAYCPSETSAGYGYASVPELIDGAYTDPREFVIEA